ncbi:hypothetical protein IRZ53_21075 [Pseudomonas fulva]|uniref:hypothetical protein n=1 Tax=Pseudomonas fulva TaxID=47880 RepID=UPI0018AC38C7|nr:hypothetical protein [Pseudomonas fulva]MBF8676877.1 hypothetical protein [Pseudomonas fulva]MBF8699280.1 hypothetical protein [Pseudomonas fulva]
MIKQTPPTSKRALAEQTRQAQREARRQRNAPLLAELAPTVQGIADPADGTLLRSAVDNDLEVRIPAWEYLPEDGDIETVYLQLSTTGDAAPDFEDVGESLALPGPATPADFPLEMQVPLAKLVEGRLWLRYRIVTFNGGHTTSAVVSLICDRTAPRNRANPDDKLDGLTVGAAYIDDEYLIDNPSGIVAQVPAYDTYAPGDTYKVYYFENPPEEHEDYENPVNEGVLDASGQVVIPKDVVNRAGDGKYYLAYYLYDKAGNKSRISLVTSVDVALGALPDNLKDPLVPAADDGVVDLKDAIAGVWVDIPSYDGAKAQDRIAVTWGDTPLPPETVGAKTFPISVPVPNSTLRIEYGKASGDLPTNVSYHIMRGAIPFGPKAISVNVDFSVVGPERPDPDPTWPNPVNPDLAPPTVRGANSATDNVIDRSDADENAILTLPLYENADDGHVLDVYWHGRFAATHTVDMALDAGGITISIPWDVIYAAGNDPLLPVHYTLRESEDALNEQVSVTQPVDVDAVTVILPLPRFLRAVGAWLNCDSLRDKAGEPTQNMVLRVEIPDMSAHLQAGDVIELQWAPLIGSSDADGDDPVPGAQKTELVTLDEKTVNGFVWKIEPYADHLLPTYDANPNAGRTRARVRYVKAGDADFASEWAVHRLSLAEGSASCILPSP